MYTFVQWIEKEQIYTNLMDRFLNPKTQKVDMARVHATFGGMVDQLKGKYNKIVRRRMKNKMARKSRRINRHRG